MTDDAGRTLTIEVPDGVAEESVDLHGRGLGPSGVDAGGSASLGRHGERTEGSQGGGDLPGVHGR